MTASFSPCPKCGIAGIHACPGRHLEPPTEAQLAEFRSRVEALLKQHVPRPVPVSNQKPNSD